MVCSSQLDTNAYTRFKSLIFWLYADPSKLNPRLDERVDKMIEVRYSYYVMYWDINWSIIRPVFLTKSDHCGSELWMEVFNYQDRSWKSTNEVYGRPLATRNLIRTLPLSREMRRRSKVTCFVYICKIISY